MSRSFILLLLFFTIHCASQKSASSSNRQRGDTRTKSVELIDDNTYLLQETSDDPTYAFEQSNPAKVGSKNGSGPKNERRFLNALLGPNGEQITYRRTGSCCPFKTPNGILDNTGLLDHYVIFWAGGKDTLDIYINMYDEGDLRIPVGLTAKTKH